MTTMVDENNTTNTNYRTAQNFMSKLASVNPQIVDDYRNGRITRTEFNRQTGFTYTSKKSFEGSFRRAKVEIERNGQQNERTLIQTYLPTPTPSTSRRARQSSTPSTPSTPIPKKSSSRAARQSSTPIAKKSSSRAARQSSTPIAKKSSSRPARQSSTPIAKKSSSRPARTIGNMPIPKKSSQSRTPLTQPTQLTQPSQLTQPTQPTQPSQPTPSQRPSSFNPVVNSVVHLKERNNADAPIRDMVDKINPQIRSAEGQRQQGQIVKVGVKVTALDGRELNKQKTSRTMNVEELFNDIMDDIEESDSLPEINYINVDITFYN